MKDIDIISLILIVGSIFVATFVNIYFIFVLVAYFFIVVIIEENVFKKRREDMNRRGRLIAKKLKNENKK